MAIAPASTLAEPPALRRYGYLALLCLLAIITYLDRVCISVAGPRMQEALHLGPDQWGWVGTAFLVGYALFEIPAGHMGDRVGARRVLTRIVLAWSLFTILTGTVTALWMLLAVRFLFGTGEAGAFPNASVAISRWFPVSQRGFAFGIFIMFTQVGGALSPLLVLPIQRDFGWRMSFFVFGCVGIAWAIAWYWQYRDGPDGAPSPSPAHAQRAAAMTPVLRSGTLWLVMTLTFGYVYTMSFYQTWLHTFLVKGRGFAEAELTLSSMPYAFGAAGNLVGGLACDRLSRSVGLAWSRRAVGMTGAILGTCALVATLLVESHLGVVVCLSLVYAGITLQQPAVFLTCLDIGGVRAGVVTGFMNTSSQVGGAVSSVVFGYIVRATGSYDSPLVVMTILMGVGPFFWLAIDARRRIEAA
jgi:sugar phosphate permease